MCPQPHRPPVRTPVITAPVQSVTILLVLPGVLRDLHLQEAFPGWCLLGTPLAPVLAVGLQQAPGAPDLVQPACAAGTDMWVQFLGQARRGAGQPGCDQVLLCPGWPERASGRWCLRRDPGVRRRRSEGLRSRHKSCCANGRWEALGDRCSWGGAGGCFLLASEGLAFQGRRAAFPAWGPWEFHTLLPRDQAGGGCELVTTPCTRLERGRGVPGGWCATPHPRWNADSGSFKVPPEFEAKRFVNTHLFYKTDFLQIGFAAESELHLSGLQSVLIQKLPFGLILRFMK